MVCLGVSGAGRKRSWAVRAGPSARHHGTGPAPCPGRAAWSGAGRGGDAAARDRWPSRGHQQIRRLEALLARVVRGVPVELRCTSPSYSPPWRPLRRGCRAAPGRRPDVSTTTLTKGRGAPPPPPRRSAVGSLAARPAPGSASATMSRAAGTALIRSAGTSGIVELSPGQHAGAKGGIRRHEPLLDPVRVEPREAAAAGRVTSTQRHSTRSTARIVPRSTSSPGQTAGSGRQGRRAPEPGGAVSRLVRSDRRLLEPGRAAPPSRRGQPPPAARDDSRDADVRGLGGSRSCHTCTPAEGSP